MFILFFNKYFIYFQREEKGGEREGEKHRLVASHTPSTQACALTRNQTRPFGLQASIQPAEPHQPGPEKDV